MRKNKSSKGFIAALIIISLLFCILMVLSKNTLPAYAIATAIVINFITIRSILIKQDRYTGLVALTSWAVCLVLFTCVYILTYPPYKRVPAVDGKFEYTVPVRVKDGTLIGVYNKEKTVEIYAGIPYAKPPVGDLRWKAPEKPDRYDDVLVCDSYGPMAMQPENSPLYSSLYNLIGFHKFSIDLYDNYREPVSEDCLYLNIYKPADYAGEPLPVIFYVHGGSLTTGQSYYSEYRGDDLAEKGVIFVNFAYRLGVFGYFASEELAGETDTGTTGNYGLLDQIRALEWVHENIAAFGGDPDNITIAGESAGSSSVNALCVSPLTEGLFRRAIAESSSVLARKPYHTFRTLEKAIETGTKIMEEMGASTMAEMRSLSAKQVLSTKYPNNSMTVDGYAIVEEPYKTYEKGENHEEALLNGFNAKEADAFLLSTKATTANYEELLRPISGKYASELAALIPATSMQRDQKFIVDAGGEAKAALCHIYSAAWFTYSHYLWSSYMADQGRPVYEYYFTKTNKSLSNFHAGELPYAYGNLWRSPGLYDDADYELSEIMQNYWVNFAKTGDPNGADLPVWEPVTKENKKIIELSENISMIDDPYLNIYEILDKYQAE